MIYGVGTDIAKCSRFVSFVNNPTMIKRFFNSAEIIPGDYSEQKQCEHYASRFAAKEAFVKALGTGFGDIELKDIFITKDSLGKPIINVENNAKKHIDEIGKCNIQVSISHEKEYAIAFVTIEKLD